MKEQYNKLLRHSSMQQKKIDSMQKTMEQIVTNLGALSKVVDKIDGIGGKPQNFGQNSSFQFKMRAKKRRQR